MSTMFRTLLLSATVSLLALQGAWAQANLPQPITKNTPMVKRGPAVAPAQPSAVPGARSDAGAVAPMSKPPSEMEPTEALFDAVNRGDMKAAREAVNRGADYTARDVLGMTPVDLAIDLGRNDITFLLLSLRGPVSSQPAIKSGSGATKFSLFSDADKQAAKAARTPVAAAAPKNAPAGGGVPKYAANSPGTPDPQAGFLGFGAKLQ